MHARPAHLWASLPLRLHSRRCLSCSALPFRVAKVLDRHWLLPDPAVQVTRVQQEHQEVGTAPLSFCVIRDDLTHPLLGGNKFRKLDGLWGGLAQATDVVTCGGLQSAHTVAVAAACAERGKRCHLLVRDERPAVPTGHHLYARMLAHRVKYVSRGEYADRAAMFDAYLTCLRQHPGRKQPLEGQPSTPGPPEGHLSGPWQSPPPQEQAGRPADLAAGQVAERRRADGQQQQAQLLEPLAAAQASASYPSSDGSAGGSRVAVIPEGAACSASLLGLVRLVAWLAHQSPLAGEAHSSSEGGSGGGIGGGVGSGGRWNIVVDSGTGATATGLAVGAALLGLPWRVSGVMLAGPLEYYQQQQQELTAAFCAEHWAATAGGEGPGTGHTLAGAAAADAATAAAADAEAVQRGVAERLTWLPRPVPRRFGRVLPGEVAACRSVAQRHGILLDPIWSLAAWEVACELAAGGTDAAEKEKEAVAMLHTGGMLGLCGLAQRYPDQF